MVGLTKPDLLVISQKIRLVKIKKNVASIKRKVRSQSNLSSNFSINPRMYCLITIIVKLTKPQN